jgi:hypothetical protein
MGDQSAANDTESDTRRDEGNQHGRGKTHTNND